MKAINDKKSHRRYDYEANNKLNNYVQIKYQNQLSNGALLLYSFGIPRLEQRKSGFCKQFITDYVEIGKASYKIYSKLRKPLLELKDVLCEIEIGKPIKGGKKATAIRRYTLFELKEAKRKSKIVDKDPVHAKKLSEILESRSFVYGNEPECKPYWNVTRTGRVTSHKPNVQGDGKKDRIESLRQGLQKGQVLLDLDIQQAEPSIIQQVLKYKFDSDPYNLLAKILDVDRQKAKSSLNMLAYANSAVKILQHWPPEAQELFRSYAESLDEYKAKLWEYGKPNGRQRRFADTLGGSRVYANRGDRNHRGKPMNWHIQGTIADIINNAALDVIQKEPVEGWRLLFPEHDSMYVICKTNQIQTLREIVIAKAKDLKLNLSVDSKTYTLLPKDNSKNTKINLPLLPKDNPYTIHSMVPG